MPFTRASLVSTRREKLGAHGEHVIRDVMVRLALRDEPAVGAARRATRALATEQGLSLTATEALATAVSEVARNAVIYAEGGELLLGVVHAEGRVGVFAMVRDRGPGIANVDQAMQDGYSSGRSLGFGLPGARRLVDDFDLQTHVPGGTIVTLQQWVTESSVHR